MAAVAQFQSFGPFFNAGALVGSPKVYHYIAGTTTLLDAWTDRAKMTTAAQPLVGNANGVASAYFDGLYKIVVTTNDDLPLFTWDNVNIVTLDLSDTGTFDLNVGGNATYTSQGGTYFRMFGSIIFFEARLVINILGTGSASTISGLPSTANSKDYAVAITESAALALSPVSLSPKVGAGTDAIYLRGRTAGATGDSLLNLLQSGSALTISGWYIEQ